MVRVVPRVLDCDVPEKTAVRPQDVVRPGPHLPSFSKHPPHPMIPTPPALSRQEVFRHVLESLSCQRRCDVFRSPYQGIQKCVVIGLMKLYWINLSENIIPNSICIIF